MKKNVYLREREVKKMVKKRIICFGDSNTWGYNSATQERFDDDVRWTNLLQKILGSGYEVIAEGLSGRTSVVDDPLFEGLKGLDYIYPCLMSHSPVELIVIMLGTNDTKERFALTSFNIAQGIVRLAKKANNTLAGPKGSKTKVLVVSPPKIGEKCITSDVGLAMGYGCSEKSDELGTHLKTLCDLEKIHLLDTNGVVDFNTIDYMHLDAEGHEKMAKVIYKRIVQILNIE
jgi:lysophospholipase L1-like esterase